VQFLIGGDLCDRRKLHRDVSREFCVQNQSLAIGLHNRTAQMVTILQGDLIGENCRR
jgi:hypothetical protein